jgi:hypothetical protein
MVTPIRLTEKNRSLLSGNGTGLFVKFRATGLLEKLSN